MGVELQVHRMFIESLDGVHAQTMIFSRYVNFLQSVRKCNKLPVMYLLEKVRMDMNTLTGCNIRHVLNETGNQDLFKIKVGQLKKEFKFQELPEEELRRVNMIKEIVDLKQNVLVLESDNDDIQLSDQELTEILEYLATY